MTGRVAARVLLGIVLASVAGTLLSCKSTPKGPLAVTDGLKVTMDMTITILPDKSVALSTVGKKPFSFIQGKHEHWPSLEIALAGMTAGQKKTIPLTADQAAGPYDESKRRTVKLGQLPPGTRVGTKVRSKESGAEARVVKISGDSAEIDYNDFLAGKDLIVDVTILKVEKP